MEETKKNSKELVHRAMYMKEMRFYYQSAITLLEEMVDANMISFEEDIRRRATLLARVTDNVLGVFNESVQATGKDLQCQPKVEARKGKTAPYAPQMGIEGPTPGNLPIKGATLTPIVDETGFCSAKSIADALGNVFQPIVVGMMARALGIYGVTGNDNEWGFYSPISRNNMKINDNWRYSQKSQQILMSTLREYIEKKKAASKKTTISTVINDVVAGWPGYPLTEPAPTQPPAAVN